MAEGVAGWLKVWPGGWRCGRVAGGHLNFSRNQFGDTINYKASSSLEQSFNQE